MTAQRRFRAGHRRRVEIAAALALLALLFAFAAAPPLPRAPAPVRTAVPEILILSEDEPAPAIVSTVPPPPPRPSFELASSEPVDVAAHESDEPDEATLPPPPDPDGAAGATREGFRSFSTPPEPRTVVEPEYPEMARSLGIEGRVVCEVTIDETGRVMAVRILESDSALLEEAARDAVVRWTFTPATQSGQPVTATVVIPILFRLR